MFLYQFIQKSRYFDLFFDGIKWIFYCGYSCDNPLLPLEQFFASKPFKHILYFTSKACVHGHTSPNKSFPPREGQTCDQVFSAFTKLPIPKISRGRCNLHCVTSAISSNHTWEWTNISAKQQPCDLAKSLSHQYGKATMLMQQLVTRGATRPKPASHKPWREWWQNQEPWKNVNKTSLSYTTIEQTLQNIPKQAGLAPGCQEVQITLPNLTNATKQWRTDYSFLMARLRLDEEKHCFVNPLGNPNPIQAQLPQLWLWPWSPASMRPSHVNGKEDDKFNNCLATGLGKGPSPNWVWWDTHSKQKKAFTSKGTKTRINKQRTKERKKERKKETNNGQFSATEWFTSHTTS